MTPDNVDRISVDPIQNLHEGRVKNVTARATSLCLVHFDGPWAAMNNHYPHHKGPLGEGSIEKALGIKGPA